MARKIEDLRGKHQGKEIWVLGCGPSLDDFPDDFFDDKITIAMNWAIVAFPQCTYWLSAHVYFHRYLLDEKPELLRKSIVSFPAKGRWSDHGMSLEAFFGDLTSQVMSMQHSGKPPYLGKEDFEDTVEGIMAGRHCLYRVYKTIAHLGIEAAAIMGAKRITMVGCEHLSRGHAQKRGMGARYGKAISKSYSRIPLMANGTRWLAELFGKHGVAVVRYFYKDVERSDYKKGYNTISKGGDAIREVESIA